MQTKKEEEDDGWGDFDDPAPAIKPKPSTAGAGLQNRTSFGSGKADGLRKEPMKKPADDDDEIEDDDEVRLMHDDNEHERSEQENVSKGIFVKGTLRRNTTPSLISYVVMACSNNDGQSKLSVESREEIKESTKPEDEDKSMKITQKEEYGAKTSNGQ